LIEPANQTASLKKYRQKLDLYEHKQIEKVSKQASDRLDLRADMVEWDLYQLTDRLEAYRDQQLTLTKEGTHKPTIPLTPQIERKCKAFLSQPLLIERFNKLIGQAGVIGEENNRIFLFCIATSYKMPDTLHGLIQGSSASGKTHLLIKISDFIPEEGRKRFTRVTESSFYNYGMYDLQHQLICLEDFEGMKEEAQLAFRELQSRGQLISSTSTQDEAGHIRAIERVVYGPIASVRTIPAAH